MIKFVVGTSGSGKTYYARHAAAQLALSGQKTAILVPEQFSFETERAMLELLEPKYADMVEVLSFTKLASKISREVGGTAGRRLDECGRAAVMNVAMNAVQDNLALYSGSKRGQDLISNMLDAVGEFKSCMISPEMLSDAADNIEESVLSQKLRELSLIYGAYNACIANIDSIDPLDELSRLTKNLEQVDYFDGMTVIADSFTGFTRQELSILQKIIEQCECFTITLCCGEIDTWENTSSMDLFDAVHNTVGELSQLDSDIIWEHLPNNYRFKNEALRRVEAGVFQAGKGRIYAEPTDDVIVYSAADKYDEVEFVAREIRRLARENSMRWRDFAIICRTASDYQIQTLRALTLQGIPCFCDKRAPVTELPIIRFVLAALDIVSGRWRSEKILNWVKTGLIKDVGIVDAARLENYCFIWKINGNSWKHEFTQSAYGYTDGGGTPDSEILQNINASRECIVNLLDCFQNTVRSDEARGRDMATAVYNLIDSAGAAECIERMLPSLSPEDANTQGQVWNALMNMLDQLAEILGDARISFREFSELFTLMVGLCDVGKIPQGMDEVVFGTADRIRTSNPKVVFVLGANDEIFPLMPTQGGVFTDSERKMLINMQIPISGDMEQNALSEQFLAYSAMTCASDKLYVTYSKSNGGQVLYSSEIVSELRRIVPGHRQVKPNNDITIEMIENVEAGFLLAAGCIDKNSSFSSSLLECYRGRKKYSDKIEVVRNANIIKNRALHSKNSTYSLFGRNINISASKAECFYNCKFMYFCKYGMKVAPLRRADLNSLEYGSVVHYVLEKLLKNYDVGSLMGDPDLKQKISPFLEEYLNDVMGGSDMKSARFMYLFKRLAETLAILTVQLGEEFAKSLFEPYSFELPIGDGSIKSLKIPLSDGTSISVGGKIDRVDIFNNGGINYVRVVDYKTGSKEFVLSDILSGLNMQMLIYLDIICDKGLCSENFEPAGVVYSPASMGKISGTRGDTSFEDERQNMLKKNGLIVDDSEVINAMEIGMEKKVDKRANSSVKCATTFSSASTYVANMEQFSQIRLYIRSLLKEMGESLHNGEIDALPAKGSYDACAYCDYRVICSQEQKTHGREIKKKDMAETFDIISAFSEVNT